MTVKVYAPAISVNVVKRITRSQGDSERVRGSRRRIDLAPFLGEGSSVVVRKNIREPAGTFSITLVDQASDRTRGGLFDSLYGRLEPMDYVEIRMSHDASVPGVLPIMMRGFITNVRRTETMAGERPQRRVIITGQDYGKLFQVIGFYFGPRYEQGNLLLTEFRLQLGAGMSIDRLPANSFVRQVVSNVLNPWISGMRNLTGTAEDIPLVGIEASIPEGLVAPYGFRQFEGSMWQFITQWIDMPWNEIFVEDREGSAGPVIVARATPFYRLDGSQIQAGPRLTPVATLTNDDISSVTSARSDANLANYYWVDPAITELENRELMVIAAAVEGNPFDRNPNSAIELYGLRQMKATTNQLGGGAYTLGGVNEQQRRAVSSAQGSWTERRRELLKAMNGDNVVFEDGSIEARADTRVRAGRYFEISRGSLKWTAYAVGVTHNFTVFGPYTMSVDYERGTGFAERTALEASPYLGEIPGGPYV